ncbi:nucleotidyltransferase family protein [Pontibacter litorisediminis]|uniref:nucleotidyltransferase family protein n=1 Tax=Pontibacter litorisediminis TaxID=1846260 RepID=UPI0023ED5CCD|nr:nucleotidyltransferase family protein [Pontibacter litorisediminis]
MTAGLVILAAGASSRLGEPKQQLQFQGQSLLQRAVQAGLEAGFAPLVVVLGANAAKFLPELREAEVTVVRNPEWQEGMSASIRCGLEELLRLHPETSGAVFMVCDQPYATAAVLKGLLQAKQGKRGDIVASAYQNTLGTPVLFDKAYFPELLALRGQEGAKKVILKHKEAVIAYPFPAGAIDIDTAADYAALLRAGLTG